MILTTSPEISAVQLHRNVGQLLNEHPDLSLPEIPFNNQTGGQAVTNSSLYVTDDKDRVGYCALETVISPNGDEFSTCKLQLYLPSSDTRDLVTVLISRSSVRNGLETGFKIERVAVDRTINDLLVYNRIVTGQRANQFRFLMFGMIEKIAENPIAIQP